MRRGTTPTITFNVSVDTSLIDILDIAFAQDGKVIVTKTKPDCTITENTIACRLTEEETMTFQTGKVLMQIRIKFTDGNIAVSDVMLTSAEVLLQNEVIENVQSGI